MPMNALGGPTKARRNLAVAGVITVIAASILIAIHLHAWTSRRNLDEEPFVITAVVCLALTGIALYNAMLPRWALVFALSCLCIALLIALSITALFY